MMVAESQRVEYNKHMSKRVHGLAVHTNCLVK